MISPSGRKLKQSSNGYKLLKILSTFDKPAVFIDTADVLTGSIIASLDKDYFSGFWISSLGNSLQKGFEDAYNLNPRDYESLIHDLIITIPKKLIVVDADNGGQSYKNTSYAFKLYASLGVSAAFVENKIGAKFNSLEKNGSHQLANQEDFSKKISAAISTQSDTLVGIRIEDGILNDSTQEKAVESALDAVSFYLKTSKPDLFLFHWKLESPEAPLLFAKQYQKIFKSAKNLPFLACVPTAYSKNISNLDLYQAGYKLIIFGNPILRSHAYSTKLAITSIIQADSLVDQEEKMISLKETMKINRSFGK